MRKVFLKTPLNRYLSDAIGSEVFPIPYRNELGTIIPGIKIEGKYSYFYYFKDEYYENLIDSMLDYYLSNLIIYFIPSSVFSIFNKPKFFSIKTFIK